MRASQALEMSREVILKLTGLPPKKGHSANLKLTGYGY
jgi:hypothetical protein